MLFDHDTDTSIHFLPINVYFIRIFNTIQHCIYISCVYIYIQSHICLHIFIYVSIYIKCVFTYALFQHPYSANSKNSINSVINLFFTNNITASINAYSSYRDNTYSWIPFLSIDIAQFDRNGDNVTAEIKSNI